MKKRILHVVSMLPRGGGVEQVTFNLVTSLNPEKYESIVCCLQGKGELGEELEELGIKVITLGMSKSFSLLTLFNNIKAFLGLISIMRKYKIDIVHTHEFFSGTIGRLAAWVAHARVILLTLHTRDEWKDWRHILIDRLLAKVTNNIVANSKAVKNFTADFEKIDPYKFEVIYNGIDETKFCSIVPGNHESPVVGNVGRLTKEKGCEYLVKAFPIILSKIPECKLFFVGDALPEESIKDKLRATIDQLNISDKVILKGNRDDVPELISEFDVFVLPSLKEGFGIAAVEAMAMGKPVVASNVDGIPEVMENGKTGILVPPGDSKALADAILLLLKDKEKSMQMGRAGKERVNKMFTNKIMAGKYEILYDRLIQKENS